MEENFALVMFKKTELVDTIKKHLKESAQSSLRERERERERETSFEVVCLPLFAWQKIDPNDK